MRHDHHARWCLAVVAALAEAGVWALAIARGGAIAVVAAVVVQLGTVMPIAWNLPRRRGLAAALGIAVPVIGPIAATLAATVSGHGGRELLRDPHAETRPIDGQQIVHALAGALPACEAVLSADRETRRSSLARLARRATASDLAILRWARAQSSGEIAVEIALALEDAVARFESRASRARAAALDASGYETRAHAFRVLVEGIASGIVDEQATLQLATEARRHHEAAIAADAERARELLADRARLELAVDRPEAALELLTPIIGADAELVRIYKQAAYAARRFELAAELTRRRSRAQDRV